MSNKSLQLLEKLSRIFGQPITALDPTKPPSELDIIRYWMTVTKNSPPNADLRKSPIQQKNVITKVVATLTDIWHNGSVSYTHLTLPTIYSV